MERLKKIQKWVEAINTYYGFALIVYAAILYITSASYLFWWIFIIITPLLAGWTGYLLQSFMERRTQRHGFKVISDSVSYEIESTHKYILRFSTQVKACADHLMVYPIAHQWTGSGEEGIPTTTGPGQQVLAPFELKAGQKGKPRITTYKTLSTEGEWRYWFIALNPPVHKGDVVTLAYSQSFQDKKDVAKPYLAYFVKTPMANIELNVKFALSALPVKVVASYTQSSDPSRPYIKTDALRFDPDKQWVTWAIEKPKKGYCYRIQWQ